MKKLITLLVFLSSIYISGQITVKGIVFDEYLEPFSGAIISSSSGKKTTSDYDGNFVIELTELPATLTINSVGYSTENVVVTTESDEINVILKEASALNQIVISASRTPESIMESPVTIERISEKFINNTASPNFYEGLKNLKGIDIIDNNYLTKNIVSNRGFATTENARFIQLVDGVDTAVPVFDYSLGNIFGLSELDVENVEILPGAASALYGANALNGILLATSKNPFEHTGFSAYGQTGFTATDPRGNAGFLDSGFRFAHKFSDHFAAKINVSYQTSRDWLANDLRDINGGDKHIDGNISYDGINVYGDEVSFNIVDLALFAEQTELSVLNPLGLLSSTDASADERISRTGYLESEIVGDKTVNNILFDLALHFRPWKNNTELIIATKQSQGDNVALSGNRYFQENSSQSNYRIELKDDNYFVRAYYNENNAGDTFDSKLAAVAVNRGFNPDEDGNAIFFQQYADVYFNRLNANASNADAHRAARSFVDSQLESLDFNELLKTAKKTNISDGGAKLFENSGFYNVDANWNLSELINFENLQIGGNFRSYALNSKGQVYTDFDGVLRYRQFGFYAQLQRKFSDDKLKFSGTLRYDKSRNFEGRFNPRATISYAAGEKRNHNFRIGFQTGFRNPTSQDQYSGIDTGNAVLLGSVKENLDIYSIDVAHRSTDDITTLTGNDAFENSFTSSSVAEFQSDFRNNALIAGSSAGIAIDPSLLVVSDLDELKPETVRSFELGYRAAVDLGGKLFEFDIVGYYNIYEDFITETEVVTPVIGDVNNFETGSAAAILTNDFQRFQIATNATSIINAYGYSAGFNTKIFNKFNFGGSYAFSNFNIDEDENSVDFKPSFNTPKNSIKFQLNTDNLFRNFGAGVDVRWQDEFLYQSRFVDQIVESRFVMDAQVNYQMQSIKSVIKLGATNLFGKEYISVPEAGIIGSQFYIGWTYNN